MLVVCVVTAAGAVAARTGFPVPLPTKAKRILQRDWCSRRSYTRAEAVKGVSKDARRALRAAEKVARAHVDGCRAAEYYARRTKEGKFPSGACPKHLAPLEAGDASAAAATAADFEGRALRPVIVGYGRRHPEVWHACGGVVARRTVTIAMSLTAYLPSASLSERVVAVSHVRGGWRVWLVLH